MSPNDSTTDPAAASATATKDRKERTHRLMPQRRDPEERKRAQKAERARQTRQRRAQQDRARRAAEAEQAALEAASDDRLLGASSRAYTLIAAAFAVALFVVAGVLAFLGDSMALTLGNRILFATGFALAGFLSFVVATSLPPIRRARKEFRRREALARNKARQAMDELSDATDLSSLLIANRKQMDAYDDLARLQAKESFRNSQAAIAIGLFALLVGGLVALLADDTASKITTATLTGAAAALSGYIGRTFLRVYDRAQQQLTFFFQQPLVNSYILAAERLVKDMDNNDKEISRIVDHVMDVLVQLPANWHDWTGERNGRRRAGLPTRASNGVRSDAPQDPE